MIYKILFIYIYVYVCVCVLYSTFAGLDNKILMNSVLCNYKQCDS